MHAFIVVTGIKFYGNCNKRYWRSHSGSFSRYVLQVAHKRLGPNFRKLLPHASKVLFLALSVISFVVNQISGERLNAFAQNSQGRRLWSLTRRSLTFECQGHQGQKRAVQSHHSPRRGMEWNALAANNATQQHTEPFRCCLA